MVARAQGFIDTWLGKLTSRKLMVWGVATYLAMSGQLASEDWVIISAIYIGGQTVGDTVARLKGLE